MSKSLPLISILHYTVWIQTPIISDWDYSFSLLNCVYTLFLGAPNLPSILGYVGSFQNTQSCSISAFLQGLKSPGCSPVTKFLCEKTIIPNCLPPYILYLSCLTHWLFCTSACYFVPSGLLLLLPDTRLMFAIKMFWKDLYHQCFIAILIQTFQISEYLLYASIENRVIRWEDGKF